MKTSLFVFAIVMIGYALGFIGWAFMGNFHVTRRFKWKVFTILTCGYVALGLWWLWAIHEMA